MTYDELKREIENISAGQKNLSLKFDKLREEVRLDNLPRIEKVESSIPLRSDLDKLEEITTALGNWRFLIKFFSILSAAITFVVGTVYMIIKIIESL